MGGISREREVSIQSGKCVAEALKKAGVNVVTSDIKPDAMGILDDETIDVFFIALHGTFGEDGELQKSSNPKISFIREVLLNPAGLRLTNGKAKNALPQQG